MAELTVLQVALPANHGGGVHGGSSLTRNLSVFLDLLRLSAAMLVFAGHMALMFALPLPSLLGHSAKEGVAIFFVLSGFVIAFVGKEKEQNWRAYACARALRMYSVVPLTVLVLLICHVLGSYIAPQLYDPAGGGGSDGVFGSPPNLPGILRYLTFTNEIWFDRSVIATGAPFWSLGYEVAYYVAFGIAFYARGFWRIGLLLLWVAICGPRIVAAFPLWLLGVGAYHLLERMPRLAGWIGWPLLGLTMIAGLAVRRTWGNLAAPLFEWPAPAVLATSMAYYLALSVLVAAAILIFAASTARRSFWPAPVARGIAFFAGASFTLYLAHIPVLVLVMAMFPGVVGSVAGAAFAGLFTLVVMLLLAEIGERRKNFFKKLFPNFPVLMRMSS